MNIFDICTFGFFTDYPNEDDVKIDIDFAHDQIGTLNVLGDNIVELPIDIIVDLGDLEVIAEIE
jgi:hypothetical protein